MSARPTGIWSRTGAATGTRRSLFSSKDHPDARAADPRLPRALGRDRLGRVRGPCRPAAAPARGGRAELLHHEFLRPEIRPGAGALSRSSSGFDGIVVSGDERLLKPDPAIYRPAARPLWPRRRRIASSSTIRRPMWKGPARWACTRSTASNRSTSPRSCGGTGFRFETNPRLEYYPRHHRPCAGDPDPRSAEPFQSGWPGRARP